MNPEALALSFIEAGFGAVVTDNGEVRVTKLGWVSPAKAFYTAWSLLSDGRGELNSDGMAGAGVVLRRGTITKAAMGEMLKIAQHHSVLGTVDPSGMAWLNFGGKGTAQAIQIAREMFFPFSLQVAVLDDCVMITKKGE